MNAKRIKAYGKLNIGLDIIGVTDDGYHELKTIFQTVDLYDDVLVRKRREGISVKTNRPYIPDDERNLAYKAAAAIIERYDIKQGVRIDIGKRIPVGGGMAGGSTDAAAVIKAMDVIFSLHMDEKEKDEIALSLGADVPFCLRNGCYLAEGVGEKLTQLDELPPFHVLICAPSFSVSTKWAYDAFDDEEEKFHPDMDALLEALKRGDKKGLTDNMGNSLEAVVEKEYPDIQRIKNLIEGYGAEKAMMSGSGSVVFGLFDEKAVALKAADSMKNDFKKGLFVTSFVRGIE